MSGEDNKQSESTTALSKRKVFIIAFYVVAGVFAATIVINSVRGINTTKTAAPESKPVPEATTTVPAKAAKLTVDEVVKADPYFTLNAQKVSELFRDYATWDEKQKLDFVTEVMNVSQLPEDVLALLKQEIQNKQNRHLLRNNMANALMAQQTPDYELENIFWRMFNDTTESATWRDYSLQFYAECAKFVPYPVRIRDNLAGLALKAQPDKNSGTAAMMLTHEAQLQRFELPEEFAKKVRESLLASTDPDLQAAGLSVLTRARCVSELPLLREKLKDANPLLRRVAAAGLGELGEAGDLALLNPLQKDADARVAKAAQAAVSKLQKRQSTAVKPN